jgi:hypothetical protein
VGIARDEVIFGYARFSTKIINCKLDAIYFVTKIVLENVFQ